MSMIISEQPAFVPVQTFGDEGPPILQQGPGDIGTECPPTVDPEIARDNPGQPMGSGELPPRPPWIPGSTLVPLGEAALQTGAIRA